MWVVLAFAFATLGSKLLLGLWAVWLCLPDRAECSRCDHFTAVLEPHRGLRTLYLLCRMQQRWCPRCGDNFLARGRKPPRLFVGDPASEPEPEPTPSQVLARRSQ